MQCANLRRTTAGAYLNSLDCRKFSPTNVHMSVIRSNETIYPIFIFRAPNGIKLVNALIEDRTGYVPCGHFNKDNSCDLPFVHLNEKNENMIHSCALCYFVLSGLINVHLLKKCPLLSFIS